jgi:hypothetical protein
MFCIFEEEKEMVREVNGKGRNHNLYANTVTLCAKVTYSHSAESNE